MSSFWHDLLPHEGRSVGNMSSLDVISQGCLDVFETTACIRSSFLGFIGGLTFVFCILHTTKLHYYHHSQVHQYLVFYCASLELLLLIVKWIAINSLYQMEFLASFLKMVQFIILCNFYWSLTSRILHQQCVRIWVITPILCVFVSFNFAVTVLGLMCKFTTWEDCLAPHWILISLSEFLAIQLYVVAGIYITRKINSIASMESFKQEQKRELWSVIVSYEISSIVSLAYYITLRVLGDPELGCSDIFNHVQEVYSFVYMLFMIVKYFLPIWAMLFAFYNEEAFSREQQPLLGWSRDASSSSVFNPHTMSRAVNVYHDDSLDRYHYLRRSASFPAIASRGLVEDTLLPPSRVNIVHYGTNSPEIYANPTPRQQTPNNRKRRDSGNAQAQPQQTKYKVPVSLNQCPDEVESVTPSSCEVSTQME